MTAFLADVALYPSCTITSNTGWTGLNKLKALPLVDTAVSSRIGTAADPVTITISLTTAMSAAYAGLANINLEQYGGWRLELLSSTASVIWDSRIGGIDQDVMPSLLPWEAMPSIGDENFFRGDLPRSLWVGGKPRIDCVFPMMTIAGLRWSLWGNAFQPDGSSADYYRIGFAPVGNGLEFDRSVASQDSDDPRADVSRVAGGLPSIDPGVPAQTNTINLNLLDADTRNLLAIILRGAGADLPLVYLPNIADPAENFMWGGLRRVVGPTAHRWGRPLYTDAQVTLEEICA